MSWFSHPLGLAAHLLLAVVPVALLVGFLAVVAQAVLVPS